MVLQVKNPPANARDAGVSLGWEEPLEEGMATYSSILTGKIPWTEEPGRLHGFAESDMTEATKQAHMQSRKMVLMSLFVDE